MKIEDNIKRFWNYLKKDSWDSWFVSIILIFILIKFIIFPLLSLATGTSLPLVVVESCSMYHGTNFDDWWYQNAAWYESHNINKLDFENYAMKNGFTKGDIILVMSAREYKEGDIIIFNSETAYPIIHRIIAEKPVSTKGDNNIDQLAFEKNIDKNQILGRAVFRIPLVGWLKLIFYEPFKSPEQRGFCK